MSEKPDIPPSSEKIKLLKDISIAFLTTNALLLTLLLGLISPSLLGLARYFVAIATLAFYASGAMSGWVLFLLVRGREEPFPAEKMVLVQFIPFLVGLALTCGSIFFKLVLG